jgi:hypothetical protein
MHSKRWLDGTLVTTLGVSLLLGACGSAESAATPPPSSVVPPSAPPSSAPVATAPAEPTSAEATSGEPTPSLAAHLWRAHFSLELPRGTDLTTAPDEITVTTDDARMGTEEEVDAPPAALVSQSSACDAGLPAGLRAYVEGLHPVIHAGCHFAIGRRAVPIVEDAPSTISWDAMELCPLASLDALTPRASAWQSGEDLSAGEIGGVFLALDVGGPIPADALQDGGVALEVTGHPYALVVDRANESTPSVLDFWVGDEPATASPVIATFAGHPLEIAQP